MTLTRWNPWTDLDTLHGELQRMFDARAVDQRRSPPSRTFEPEVDIVESPEQFTLKFDLPEVKLEDLSILLEDQTLTVRGERKAEMEDKKAGYRRIERRYGTFLRSFSLPNNIEADKIHAECKDGVLRIDLPKKAEAQPRKIAIKPVN